jgi:hypothetical protein
MERMNKILITILVASLIVFANLYCVIVAQADETGVNIENDQNTQVLNNLFDALRTGDISTLKRLFVGEMYEKRKKLLEQNEGYAQFLRDYYRGAVFEINNISQYNDTPIVDFTIFLPDGKKDHIKLEMAEQHKLGVSVDNSYGRWVFTRQRKE